MNEHNCEPCTKLQKKHASVQWCVICKELLCTDCYNYHKNALTATKNHSFLTTEQYQSYLPMLKLVQTTCSKHPEKDYEFFCKDHASPCCILCKRNEHTSCKDVENIEEALADIDLKDNLNKMKNEISNSVSILKKVCADRDDNISKLQEQKERLLADIKANRECIERALNKFEGNIKNEVERNFNTEIDNILKQRNELSVKISDFEKRINFIKSVSETEFIPNMYLFLLDAKTREDLHAEYTVIDNFVKSLKNVKSECNISVEINKETMCVKMIKTIKFSNNKEIYKFNLKSKDKSDEESEITSSSTIEDDNALNIEAESSTSFALSISNKSFIRTGHFTLKSTGSKTGNLNRFIKALSNNRILIAGRFDKNMIVYNRSGKVLGEIQMKYPITAVAVIDNNIIAAASYRAVTFADTNTYQFYDLIPMRDNCVGLAFVDNKLIVNCLTRGLIVISTTGTFVKRFGNLRGEMQIFELEKKILALVKTDSPTIERVNVTTLSKMSNFDLGLIGMRSLTNCMGNVLISTPEQNKVCAIKIGSKKCDSYTLLDANDGMNEPTCIDFDMKSKELLLINDGGNSVYIFKMQVDKP